MFLPVRNAGIAKGTGLDRSVDRNVNSPKLFVDLGGCLARVYTVSLLLLLLLYHPVQHVHQHQPNCTTWSQALHHSAGKLY